MLHLHAVTCLHAAACPMPALAEAALHFLDALGYGLHPAAAIDTQEAASPNADTTSSTPPWTVGDFCNQIRASTVSGCDLRLVVQLFVEYGAEALRLIPDIVGAPAHLPAAPQPPPSLPLLLRHSHACCRAWMTPG